MLEARSVKAYPFPLLHVHVLLRQGKTIGTCTVISKRAQHSNNLKIRLFIMVLKTEFMYNNVLSPFSCGIASSVHCCILSPVLNLKSMSINVSSTD